MELKTPLRIVDDEVNGCFRIEDADGVTVADDGSATGEYAPKMTREFANLVVTAPELLEALQRMVKIHMPLTGNPTNEQLVEFWEYEKSQGRGEADDMLFVLATIAKATGSAS